MKKLQRALALALSLSMVLSLAACGSSSSDDEEEETTEETEEATEETEEAEEETEESEEAEETEEAEEEEEEEEADTTSDSEPQYGGSATFYSEEITAHYDPAMDDSYSWALWLEPLFTIDWAASEDDDTLYTSKYLTYDQLTGQIAEDEYDWDEETATITVYLRQDVYFQTLDDEYDYYGGRQVTAYDVEWSFCRLLGWNGYEQVESDTDWETSLSYLEAVNVVDDFTIEFVLTEGNTVALNDFMTGGLCVVNIAGAEWDELTEDQQSDYHYACGTGPYILTDLQVDNYATFVKNENYYDYDERYPENKLPYLDEITLVYIADSANILTQFIAGELDYIGWRSNLLSSDERSQLESTLDESEYTKWAFASSPMGIGLKMNTEYFDDINVRTAMQMAIDLSVTTAYVTGEDDPEVVVPGFFSSQMAEYTSVGTWSDELMAEYTYDPEGAMELLEEAGYADGFEFTCYIIPVSDTYLFELGASYLSAVGITMNLESLSDALTLQTYQTDETNENAYFTGSIGQDAKSGVSGFSDSMLPTGSMYSLFYDDLEEGQEMISLINEASTTTSMEELTELCQEIDVLYAESHFAIALSGNSYVYDYMSSHIGGYTGEKMKANLNYKTIVARLWSTDGT